MEYFFEHPVITGVVPVDNKYMLEELANMELKVGQELKFKGIPLIYVKSIDKDMVILSKDKSELSTCCDAPIKRGTKLAGYKHYCTKCNTECAIKKEF